VYHIQKDQGETIAPPDRDMLLRIWQRRSTIFFEFCPLCDEYSLELGLSRQDHRARQEGLLKHIERHLQSLALLSLPQVSPLALGSVREARDVDILTSGMSLRHEWLRQHTIHPTY
jgi:hypothetical protein